MADNPLGRLRRTVGLALLVLSIGVLGFHYIHGLTMLDALYMAVTTMATVGYREIGGAPDTVAEKLFTIFFILMGAGVLLYSFTTVVEVILDERTRLFFRMRADQRKAQAMEDHYIICGLGRVGRAVSEELSLSGHSFVIVDNRPERVTFANAHGWTCITGDATDDRTLERVNVARAKGLFACVETDATNLFIVISARGLNPTMEISARVVEEKNLEKFRRAGASHVYSPYYLLGRRMARSMTRPRVVELLDLALEQSNYDLAVDECRVNESSEVAGKTLAEAEFRKITGAIVLAIIRSSGEIVRNPAPNVGLNAGDVLVTLGTPEQLQTARRALG